MTDTMLAAFKRIMSLSDSKTAWIQVVCYLLGYGCFAIPGALFIKRYSYKAGVMLGLGLYALGSFLFYPAMLVCGWSIGVGFLTFLVAIFVLFAGLSILETSTNSYVCAIGSEATATRLLNLPSRSIRSARSPGWCFPRFSSFPNSTRCRRQSVWLCLPRSWRAFRARSSMP